MEQYACLVKMCFVFFSKKKKIPINCKEKEEGKTVTKVNAVIIQFSLSRRHKC